MDSAPAYVSLISMTEFPHWHLHAINKGHVVGHFTTWIPHGPVMGGVATMLLAILQHEFPMVLSWGHGHHVVGHFTTWLPHGHVMGGVAIMLLAILQHEFHMDPSAGRGTKNLFLANHMIFPCLSPLHGKFMDSSCGWPFYNMNLHVVKRPTTCCVWPKMCSEKRKY